MAKVCDPKFQAEFNRFTQNGESSPEFLAHLQSCRRCGDAVDEVFREMAEAFNQLGRDFGF